MGDDRFNQPKSIWELAKEALNRAAAEGAAKWATGPGHPFRLLNPFTGFLLPGKAGEAPPPQTYPGVEKMFQRLALTRDETSPPMRAIRTSVEKNPLLKDLEIAVEEPGAKPGGLPAGYSGAIFWRPEKPPKIALAPKVSPWHDPGVTLTHEAVGHGSHGDVRGGTPEIHERAVAPRLEGLATGVERGIYSLADLALPSGYDIQFGDRPEYRKAQTVGAAVARHYLQDKVPSQEKVLDYLFKKPVPGFRPPQKPMAGGS